MKTKAIIPSLAGALLSLGFLSHEAKAAIMVTEADFGGEYSSSSISPTWVGTLGLGINTISGSFDGTAEFDFVSVTLPESLIVTSFTLTTSNVVSSPGSYQASLLIGGSFDRLAGTAPTTHTFSPSQLTQGGITTFGIYTALVDETLSFDYTWEIVTVPEPTTNALLIGGGVAFFALLRKRRK